MNSGITADAVPAIQVRGLTREFEGLPYQVLSNISFDVPPGKFVTVVGPSGCGKSTLLMIVSALLPATSGQVLLNGREVSKPDPTEVAVVFQDATLLPWRSAVENVAFPLELRGVDRTERRQRAMELLSLVNLEKFADHYPDQLSGGMRQRVGIARGLVNNPSILLMDEPFSALDEQSRVKMGDELLRIWEKTEKTVLFITHSLIEAIYLSDYVIVLGAAPGRILETIEIDLPRPRDTDMIGSAKFGDYRNRIWHLIRDTGTVE